METDSSLPGLLRNALRHTAQTVAVVTTGGPEARSAMSATAVVPVSMDPPSMLFCVNRGASCFPLFLEGHGFCVNLLAAEHQQLAEQCSGGLKGEARFAAGEFATHPNGVPYLPSALASIFCVQDGRYLYGTHAVVLGKVTEVRLTDKRGPLLYYDGGFRRLPIADTPPEGQDQGAVMGEEGDW